MPPLDVDVAAGGPGRTLDAFFCLAFLAKNDNFGRNSPKSIEHMVDYFKWIGVNRVTIMVYANQAWGANCTIPSWDTDDKGYLDDMLERMDRAGGVGLVAGIVADGMYGKVVSGGREVRKMPADEAREVILKGFDEFLDRYAKYPSLKGIALGSMETIGFLDTLQEKGVLAEVVARIHRRRPDLEVLTYLGNEHLQVPYFSGRGGSPTTWDIVSEWEQGREPWQGMLAWRVHREWQRLNRDALELKAVRGLTVYEMLQPDDHRLHDTYSNEPRQGIYLDTFRCQALSDFIDTPHAAIFSTFTEGWIGLHEEMNFWYTRPWTAPDMNPAGAFATMAFAQAQGQRDRQTISAGTWNMKYFGLEPGIRKFARALRSLPPATMEDCLHVGDAEDGSPAPVTGTVRVRWAVHQGKRYVSAQNMTPFAQSVRVGQTRLVLGPFELAALADDGDGDPRFGLDDSPAYRSWLSERLASYEALCKEVAALNPKAVPAPYLAVAAQARKELEAGNLYTADIALAYGLVEELKLRKAILNPPRTSVPRVSAAPPTSGDLDAWPAEAADVQADGAELLCGMIYSPNSWQGPEDLSMRIRLAHDGEYLYIGVAVIDSVVQARDLLSIHVSKEAYLDWRGKRAPFDKSWSVSAPVGEGTDAGPVAAGPWVCRKTPTGYVAEGKLPLADMGTAAGGSLGLVVKVSDHDGTPNLYELATWARKQEMMWPNQPHFAYWEDARGCGRLVLE
jgi:hypothetical protein